MPVPEDTPELYRLRQQNLLEPCPWVFPKLSPAIRPAAARNRRVFLLQWGSFGVSLAGIFAAWATNRFTGGSSSLAAGAAALLLLPVSFLCRLLRRILRWRCPCCGTDFPREVPDGRSFRLEGAELLAELRLRRIPWRKLAGSPLYLPASCPFCGKKFFVTEDEPHE